MRFPFSLTCSLTRYLVRKRWLGAKRFPLVLMLEPLHACNLRCSGCGRVREYADTMGERMSVDECMASVEECDSPVVSICGGEPLIYPEIETLVERIVAQGRHVYLCTNGVLLEKKLPGLRPTSRLFVNVHLDGMDATHDRIAGRAGVFAAAVQGIRAAKSAGFQVCTNTTIYKETNLDEITVLFGYLTELGADGIMVSPGYGYEAVRQSEPSAQTDLFLTREEVRARFSETRQAWSRYRLTATPIYLDYLCGDRELPCAAWANPTRNVRGWKAPCYLVTDTHYATYQELLEKTDWDRLGPGRDPRCEHCLVHCGFEPAAVLFGNRWRDLVRMAVWQMG